MIDTTTSTSLVLNSAFTPTSITVPLQEARGEILGEALFADRDFPPYNRVAMDGIAVDSQTWQEGKQSFKIQGVQASGSKPLVDSNREECIEIMTGASLPPQYNAIIRYEDITIDGGVATITNPDLKPKEFLNVHRQGSDNAAGDCLLKAGVKLAAPQIGIAASIGKTTLRVTKKLRVSVIATGDELIPVEEVPLPHQVRISNAYAIKAAIEGLGMQPTLIHHIRDSKSELREKLGGILLESDVVVLSGGVSRGKFDFIPGILESLGVQKIFHKVKQKPGKPLWFGELKNEGETVLKKVVFGLPGNPVSAVVNCYKYIIPFLKKSTGYASEPLPRVLLSSIPRVKNSLTHFLPVTLDEKTGFQGSASLVPGNGSGDLTSLGLSDGFVEVPPDTELTENTQYNYYAWGTD